MPLHELGLPGHSHEAEDHILHVEKSVEEQTILDSFLAGDSWC